MGRKWFSVEDFAQRGIVFGNKDDAEAFVNIIVDEFEYRVGARVAAILTEQDREEFEQNYKSNPEKANQIIREKCPARKEICFCEREKLIKEILEYQVQIPGVVSSREPADRTLENRWSGDKDDWI